MEKEKQGLKNKLNFENKYKGNITNNALNPTTNININQQKPIPKVNSTNSQNDKNNQNLITNLNKNINNKKIDISNLNTQKITNINTNNNIESSIKSTDITNISAIQNNNNRKSNNGMMDYKTFKNKVDSYNQNDKIQMDKLNQNFDDMKLDIDNPMFPRDSKVTKIFGKVTDKNNKESYHGYEIATRKADEIDLGTDISKKSPFSKEDNEIIKQVFVNGIKNNKMTLGTKIMMDNERTHAIEAIESGIYVNWVSKNGNSMSNEVNECFRLGSKSKCICGHDFPDHEKIVSKKFSSKCEKCKCKFFAFIPQLPEEVGEYWLPRRKGFKYVEWRAKCKCSHGWDSHDISRGLKCRECNCYSFNSAFCCVVCNKFWQDHENSYELRNERIQSNKPVDSAYLPLHEAPEICEAVYTNIDESKPKKLYK